MIGILHSVCDGVLRRHHRSPAAGVQPAGQGSREGQLWPFNEGATVTLCSDQKASLLWKILLLVSGAADHGMRLHPPGVFLRASIPDLAIK
jgi:hypothetical protein